MAKTFNEQKYTFQRKRLLTQARRLFAAKGVMETSMSQIAKACKVTKAALYHYFKSKDAILKEIFISQVDEREKETIIGNLKRAQNLEECFRILGKHHIDDVTSPDHRDLMKIMLSETMKNAEMRKFYTQFFSEQFAKLVEEVLLSMTGGRKPEKEVRLLFFQFFASLMHYSWYQIMVGDLTPLIGDAESFVNSLARTYALRFQED